MRIIFLALLSTAAFAQRPGRLNPPYLAEMPLPQRVVAEIGGASPKEAVIRRVGAFQQLQDIIDEMSNGRAATGKYTPDEDRILGEYRTARGEIATAMDPSYVADMRRFDNEPGLRDEILTRFFSPALRAQSLAVSREMQARIAVLRRTAPAFGGGPTPAAPSAPTAAAPRTPVPQAPLPPDPSIVKAQAAKVDTKVFGLQLGDRLALPACGMMQALTMAPATTCLYQNAIADLAGALAGASNEDSISTTIMLGKDRCPVWLQTCAVVATMENDRFVGIRAITDGPSVEAAITKELRGKYGPTTVIDLHTITPNNGAAAFNTVNLFWTLPGLSVEYFEVEGAVTRGLLRIETEAVHKVRQARTAEQNKPKL